MAYYQCPECKGTFETQGLVPECAHDKQIKLDKMSVLSWPQKASGCLYENKLKQKKAFLSGKYAYQHFVPATGRGKFDAEYFPGAGILRVTVRFQADFQGSGLLDWFGSDEKLKLSTAFSEQVPQYWNNKFVLRCTREGWEDIVVTPRFRVEFGAQGAHFKMVISREDAKAKENPHGRECRGFVSLNQIVSGDPTVQDRVELRDFHMSTFNHTVGGMLTAGNDREFLEKCMDPPNMTVEKLVGVPFARLDFANNSSDASPVHRQLLAFVLAARMQLPGSHPVPILVKGCAKPTETNPAVLAQARAKAVRDYLISMGGFASPVNIEAVNGMTESRVEMRIDRSYEGSFARDERAFDYNVAAHEFGHMLGLPDEYENPTTGSGKSDPETAAKEQVKKRFSALCHEAALRPPEFPSHTSSMMSDGMTLMSWHYVTVWDALSRLTRDHLKPVDWQIMAASQG